MKVIVEIDGVRHKMVRTKATDPCSACSIEKICGYKIGSPCYSFNEHFILEK